MMARKMSFSADEKFVLELDRAVTSYRRAHPDQNCSRSTFMRLAIERAMTAVVALPAPKARVRERLSASA